MSTKRLGLVLTLVLTLAVASVVVASDPYVYYWDGQGQDSEQCDKVGEGEPGQRPPTGWMHWLFNNKGDSTTATLILSRGETELGQYSPQEPLDAANWHFYTPYFEIFDGEDNRTLEAKVVLDAAGAMPEKVVLSDYCPGVDYEELTVSKTADTSYIRTHEWDIDKWVETENEETINGTPKIWLFIDGSGDETATWTVEVTYEGFEDSDFNVSGEITIENTGTFDAVITTVDDVLAGESIAVDCGVTFPYTLPVGETLTCSYDEDGYVEGFNEVTVTTEEDEYFADAEIIWGDPDEEFFASVTITDTNPGFAEKYGEVVLSADDYDEGDVETFTYTNDFAWEDYGADNCGSFQYDNTATIVETEQSASATLKVNVQCFIYETAYAKGDDAICFIPTFNNWGWTNPILPGEYEWDLWAAAAQCDTSKGTLVGSVTVVYDGDGYVTVTYNVDLPYDLDETHVYAGTTMFPQMQQGRRGWVDTVAPGQYYNDSPFDGSEVYVIAHAVVGMPDPDFGP